jgi:site-specific recombinase XerD
MSDMHDALIRYVTLRRALGTQLREPAQTLGQFVDFLECEGAEFITSELALRWAMLPQHVQRATWARRLGMVRQFATWLSTIDTRTEVPPRRLLIARRRRNKPHIFTEQEIGQLMAEASRLSSPTGLRALTYTTLIGLLTATGLRPGEALALDNADADLTNGIFAIRQTKFGKSRFVPVADSTRAALVGYAKHRDDLRSVRPTEAFLVSERRKRL